MQQLSYESSVVQVWQRRWFPAEWWLSVCCFLTAGKPRSSLVWAGPVWENWAGWPGSLHSSSQQDQPGEMRVTLWDQRTLFFMFSTQSTGHWERFDRLTLKNHHVSSIIMFLSGFKHHMSTEVTAFAVSNLFMSSVVRWHPVLCPWRNPACGSDGSFHFFLYQFSQKETKQKTTHSQKEINWWNLEQLFQRATRNESRTEKSAWVKMMLWWTLIGNSFALIRLNYFHPPGFETFSETSDLFSLK